MADAKKIDSNLVGTAYAEEAELGYLPGENSNPGSPVWYSLAPNSFGDWGAEIKTKSPNPINPSRQRNKGQTVDLDASGSFVQDFSFYGVKDLMQGLMFAAWREKGTFTVSEILSTTDYFNTVEDPTAASAVAGSLIFSYGFAASANNGLFVATSVDSANGIGVSPVNLTADASPATTGRVMVVGYQGAAGDIDVTTSGDYATYTSTTIDFTTLGLVEGQWIYVGGDSAGTFFSNSANNGFKRVRSIAAHALVVDKSSTTMATQSSTSETIQIFFGDVLKNELDDLIIRKSYQLERTLGAPDTTAPTDLQSEVLIGSVVSEMTLDTKTADLLPIEFKFMSLDNVMRDSTEGPKQTAVVIPKETDPFNTTSDVKRIKMHILSADAEYVTPLFAYCTDAKFTVNNNVSVDKAIGVLGGFEMTAGTFMVNGSVTAYFSNVAAMTAIRNNADVTIDMILAKDNRGIILDLPLISLGDGRAKIEQDKAIMLPLNMDAATARQIDPNLDYTMMWTYFHYLPTAAM